MHRKINDDIVVCEPALGISEAVVCRIRINGTGKNLTPEDVSRLIQALEQASQEHRMWLRP